MLRRVEQWTIRSVLAWTTERFGRARFEVPRLDAEVLLSHALRVPRIQLYLDHDRPLENKVLGEFRELVQRRLNGEPVAYLTGHKEFWSLDLRVDPRALVPRPETEALVEEALECLRDHREPRVVDVGTGCGAVALALARERPDAEVWASDFSKEAVDLARENAERLGLAVHFADGDLLEGVMAALGPQARFQTVVANLPYLKPDEVRPALRFEPRMALTDENDGLSLLRRLAHDAAAVLEPGGTLAFEVASGREDEVSAILRETDFYGETRSRRDLAGIERVVSATRR